jgi:probable FeS assembly SUF system protein SufT
MRGQQVVLTQDCQVLMVPSGMPVLLPQGTQVVITQALGDSCSIVSGGQLFRVDGQETQALGDAFIAKLPDIPDGADIETQAWAWLKTVYDPEIPVSIVDLGLIYGVMVDESTPEAQVHVMMTLTSAGCGMGPVLQEDVTRKLYEIPGVKGVKVELVFDPPWTQAQMTEAAKLQLGML